MPTTSVRPVLQVAADAEALAVAAAGRILAAARAAVAARGRFRVALAGGTTPLGAYHHVAQQVAKGSDDTSAWDVWFSDERCVPLSDAQSNGRAAREHLFDRLARAPEVHFVPTHAGDPGAVAAVYARELARGLRNAEGAFPAFDLILLGMGPDGHTASLFPGDPALEEREALVVAVRAPKPPPDRVTFTLPLLNAAREVLVLASGPEKAAALSDALRGRSPRLPVALLRPTAGTLTFLADSAAAAATRAT